MKIFTANFSKIENQGVVEGFVVGCGDHVVQPQIQANSFVFKKFENRLWRGLCTLKTNYLYIFLLNIYINKLTVENIIFFRHNNIR